MGKCQIYDENRTNHAIFELFKFLIFAVHFGRAKLFLPEKIPGYAVVLKIVMDFCRKFIQFNVHVSSHRSGSSMGLNL